GKFAQAIMDFSSDICTKINPSCKKCFLKNDFKFDISMEKNYERKKVKKKFTLVFFYIFKKKYDGIIPEKYEDLICLPGIGEYTASAITSFAFGRFSVVIDTNIKRFITRVYGLSKDDITNKLKINEIGKKMFPKSNSGKFAQAIMDFSADFCTKRNPSCIKCFLKNNCEFDLGLEKKDERKKVKKKFSIVYFYVFKKKYFFLKKRPISATLGGMYEVPGTEWQLKSWPEPNVKFKFIRSLSKTIRYKLSNTDLQTKIYKVNVKNKSDIKEPGVWVSKLDLAGLPLSVLTKKIVKYGMNEK
ncbi:MAG: NUDIX domain-containing protein, partial [Pseudomonadota bacterium]|nr:NUDIX domain-containing protein [Pseudomonadota bacterium]